jgi:hypothetical protein
MLIWLKAVVNQTIYHEYDTTLFTVLISNKAPQGFMVYGQYTMAKGCTQALHVVTCIRTVSSHGILEKYHTP